MLNKLFRAGKNYFGISDAGKPQLTATSGLFGNSGVMIGKVGCEYIQAKENDHVFVFAPCGSGKSVGIVMPTLFSYKESVVVLDLNLEKFDITAGYRKNILGQEVFLFNPYADGLDLDGAAPKRKTHRYNPFSSIPKTGEGRIKDILSIASIFWPRHATEAFWMDGAQNLFLALVLMLLELREQHEIEGLSSKLPNYPVTMGEVLRQVSSRGGRLALRDYLTGVVQEYTWLSTECVSCISNFLSNTPEAQGNILSTFKAPLAIWRNPIVDAATSESDFDLRDVHKKRMTIYIGNPTWLIEEAKLLSSLIISQIISLNANQYPRADQNHSCLLLLDDISSIGKVELLGEATSYLRKFKLQVLAISQSTNQLQNIYGQDTQALLNNCAVKILFPSSIEDGMPPLVTKEDLLILDKDKVLAITGHAKPMVLSKIKYFSDPTFKTKILPPPEIPILKVDLSIFTKRTLRTEDGIAPINPEWKSTAYPLKNITIAAQCTRLGDAALLINQLERAIDFIKTGRKEGCIHDDDCGFLFNVNENSQTSIFDSFPPPDKH